MSEKLIKVGISHGDINGISYELILKTFEDVRVFEFCTPVVYGSSKILAYHRKAMELPPVNINTINTARDAGVNRLNVINCGNEETIVEFSRPTPESEIFAQKAFGKAVEDLKAGLIDVLLMAPSGKDEVPYLVANTDSTKKALKILVKDSLRLALASDKIPLSDVSSHLTVDSVTEQIRTLQSVLIHDFMITLPRIAVLSLNPAVGIKEQQYGKEETEIILPAIKSANDAGIICFGPYSADNFFGGDDYLKFDAILALYYDQGSIPFRALSAGEGVCYIANLPFVVTAPDQGASYEKAGKNESSEVPFRNALYLAVDIFKNRKIDKDIYANPLKKQYFERGSDNEKLDLTKDE
jgi:4-hydroxythreonine-4-phosphate dehydrogenase